MRSDLDKVVTVISTARVPSTEALKKAPDLASPCCASNTNSCFKENINMNKSETPKLSLEPLQMKRKKKGGGCNLRKSLAWDRAFFTEEGILNPLELSTINDVSCREGLSVISEDHPSGSQQDEDLGMDEKKDWSSTKVHSSSCNRMISTSLTLPRFPIHGSKPGSRCSDCPRPLPSLSLKRPANVNVSKAAGKELKLPKVPGLKPSLSPTSAMTRSTILRANRVKHNQITQPDFSTQRHAELKSFSKSIKNTHNASSANSLQSARHSDGNSGNSSFKRHLSINNSGSKVISENATPIRPENSSMGQQYGSATFAASFSQNGHTSGRTVHPLQNQTTKPSGLRMPSPSLSFFSQPKTLVFRDLPLRDMETDVFGSQKPGNLRLQDNLRRTPKTYSRILDSASSSGKAVSSRSECMTSSHASAIELISEQNPMHKIQDLHEKNIIERISHEEAELQKISIEVPSQSGFHQQTAYNIFKKAVDVYPLNSESCGSGWRNAESGSKQSYAFQESGTIGAIDEPPIGKNTCNSLVSNHGSTQCMDAHDNRAHNTLTMQSDCGKACKPDCHEPHMEKTDPLKYSLGDTDKDKDVLKERASEQLGVSKQNGSCCSGSTKALGQRQSKSENPYFGLKQLCGNLLKESASIEVLTNNLHSGEAHLQNPVLDLTIGGCKNDINLMPEVGDGIKQKRKGSDVQNICLKVEMESEIFSELNARDGLSPEKQVSLQNPQHEEHFEKLMFVVPDRNDRDEVIDTKMPISLSLGRRHDSNLHREKNIAQLPISVELDFVDNSLSSESCNSLILDCDEKDNGDGSVLLNITAIENLPNCLHHDTQRTEVGNCSPLPERIHQLSQKDNLEKVRKVSPCIQDNSADNPLISTMSLKDIEFGINSLRGLSEEGTILVQSPESNMLNDCSPKQSERTTSASDEFVAEKPVHRNARMQALRPAGVCSEDNALESTEDSVTGQNEMFVSILSSPSLSAKESPLEHKSCDDANETVGHTADAITDPSRVKPFSDIIKGEVSKDNNCSFSGLHPMLDHDKVEAALAPNNNHQNCLNEKSRSLVLPQNAVPFSDEWLAAIEAAGEDILTRKSGAVQNSPPDKSLPEPSPWSPVKRKNNQIGPFDCTKFNAPSDSN